MPTNQDLEYRVMLAGQVHEDILKQLINAKNDFLEVRGSGKYFWPNLIKWLRFNIVISKWKRAWDYQHIDLLSIKSTHSMECMVEPVNELNDLLVNYKDDIVGVISLAYGKEVAIDFFNIYSFGGRI